MENSTLRSFEAMKTYVELVGKMTIGFLAFCYGVGFVVESIYLSKYGITALSLIRLSYVIAGLWTLVPFILVALIVIVIWVCCPSTKLANKFGLYRHTTGRRTWLAFVTIIFIILVLIYGAWLLLFQEVGLVVNNDWIGIIIYAPMFAGLLIVSMSLYFRGKDADEKAITFNRFLGGIPMIGATAVFIIYLVTCAPAQYRLIPSHVGGGKFRPSQLMIRGNKFTFAVLEQKGIFFAEPPNREKNPSADTATEEYDQMTTAVDLIIVTDTDYFLRSNMTTLSVSRDLVKAIWY